MIQNAPKISIIIPIYNVAAYVECCILSVAAQTLPAFEVLLIDDGSTDGSGDVAREATAGDPRFRLIRQENTGLGAARNAGLAAAKGDFIAFVDSDDRLMPDYLMHLWQTLEDTGGDWVACAIQFSNADGTGSRHSAIHGQADLSLHTVPRCYSFESWSDVIVHFPSAWNKLYRRSLIEGLRFDEGVWFEDHGFFQRVAARTDHIIHLPDALYIQTRGRDGQITTQDNDRVFEQFKVLDAMQDRFAAGPHSGAAKAFARIASRLLFERSTIIADSTRRARFATAARSFLQTNELEYTTDWDADIGLSWGIEMAGTLPLSVILSWDGADMGALTRSLDALRNQTAPAHEVLVVCQTRAALRRLQSNDMPTHWQLHTAPHKGEGAAFNHGLSLAQGTYVICIQTGDTLTPWTLLNRTEAMMRGDADFGITPMHLHQDSADDAGAITYHNGLHDMTLWPAGTPAAGQLRLTPLQALDLEAACSAKILRRSFIQKHSLAFSTGPRPDWALCLNSALLAPVTIYIPQPGATISLRDMGFERWQKPLGATDLIRGHSSLIAAIEHTLPIAVQASLPQGWQRKLFARALREQVYFGNYTGRIKRPMMLLGAACTAWWYGYGPARAAGLDPFIGARLASLLAPVSVIRRKLRLRGGQVDASITPNANAPDTLHAFDLDGRGAIILRANFQTTPYTNIFFRAVPHGPALFHVSLRHAENLAVCNSQASSCHWRTEQHHSVDLSAGFADLEITFSAQSITVTLNGHVIFNFVPSGLLRKFRFPNIQAIAGFDVEGDLRPAQIIPHLPQVPIALDSRLTLRMQADAASATLHALPSGTALPLTVAPSQTASAILPAQLWRNLPDDTDLTLKLTQDAGTHTLTLTRDTICERIEALLTLPLALTDTTLCLTVLEHVRYAALADKLSTAALSRLDQIAALYGVQDFLYAHAPAASGHSPLPQPNPDQIGREVASVIARIAHSQTTDGAQRPEPLDILAATQASPQADALLFLTLAEYFCSEGRDFDGLYQMAKQRHILPIGAPQTRWGLSAALPYYMAAKGFRRKFL